MSEEPWFKVHFRTKQIVVHGTAELERIKARKTPRVILVEPARTHTCSTCGKVEAWLPSWIWFGSWKDIDEERPILKFCTDHCKEVFALSPKPRKQARSREADRLSPHEPRPFQAGSYNKLHDAKRSADPRAFPWPNYPKITDLKKAEGQCRWCGGRITSRYGYQRSTHSAKWGDARDCKSEMLLHIDLAYQTSALIERDGPGCQACDGVNPHWIDAGPMWRAELGNYIRWGDDLQVDHVVPLWSVLQLPDDERRAYFGLVNLWLLCTRCHKRKSAVEAADRAAAR